MADQKKKIVAILSDLMFRVKIQEAAKRTGFDAVFVQTQQDALARAREDPALIILDLNHSAAEPLQTISKLKNDVETSRIQLLCYVSHVQVDLKKAAQAAGCDQVLARSAFSENLPAILGRYAERRGV